MVVSKHILVYGHHPGPVLYFLSFLVASQLFLISCMEWELLYGGSKQIINFCLTCFKTSAFILEFQQIHFSVDLQNTFSLTCLFYLNLVIKSATAGSSML